MILHNSRILHLWVVSVVRKLINRDVARVRLYCSFKRRFLLDEGLGPNWGLNYLGYNRVWFDIVLNLIFDSEFKSLLSFCLLFDTLVDKFLLSLAC